MQLTLPAPTAAQAVQLGTSHLYPPPPGHTPLLQERLHDHPPPGQELLPYHTRSPPLLGYGHHASGYCYCHSARAQCAPATCCASATAGAAATASASPAPPPHRHHRHRLRHRRCRYPCRSLMPLFSRMSCVHIFVCVRVCACVSGCMLISAPPTHCPATRPSNNDRQPLCRRVVAPLALAGEPGGGRAAWARGRQASPAPGLGLAGPSPLHTSAFNLRSP